MVIFHSYVSLPEGNPISPSPSWHLGILEGRPHPDVPSIVVPDRVGLPVILLTEDLSQVLQGHWAWTMRRVDGDRNYFLPSEYMISICHIVHD